MYQREIEARRAGRWSWAAQLKSSPHLRHPGQRPEAAKLMRHSTGSQRRGAYPEDARPRHKHLVNLSALSITHPWIDGGRRIDKSSDRQLTPPAR